MAFWISKKGSVYKGSEEIIPGNNIIREDGTIETLDENKFPLSPRVTVINPPVSPLENSNRIANVKSAGEVNYEEVVRDCIAGNQLACDLLDELLQGGKLAFDRFNEIRKKIYLSLANKGDVEAQKWMGLLTLYDNPVESLSWYTKAAQQGDTDAMNSIALGYGAHGVKGNYGQDPLKSFQWRLRAAENGNSIAMEWVAREYLIGEILDYDIDKSVYWLKKAIQSGNSLAYLKLADIYNSPEIESGKYYNPDEAERFYHYVMELHDESACGSAAFSLGMIFGAELIFGGAKSTKTNAKKAVYWLYQAYWFDYYKAEVYIQTILDKTEIRISEAEFEQWKREYFNRAT